MPVSELLFFDLLIYLAAFVIQQLTFMASNPESTL